MIQPFLFVILYITLEKERGVHLSSVLNIGEVTHSYAEFSIEFRRANPVSGEDTRFVFLPKATVSGETLPYEFSTDESIKDETDMITVFFITYLTKKQIKPKATLSIKHDGNYTSITLLSEEGTHFFNRDELYEYMGSIKRLVTRFLSKRIPVTY